MASSHRDNRRHRFFVICFGLEALQNSLFSDSGLSWELIFHMAEQDANATTKENEIHAKPKKPYQDPAFRYEKVFETMALSCGKVQPDNRQCFFNRHTS
jgi:hypothetical protein